MECSSSRRRRDLPTPGAPVSTTSRAEPRSTAPWKRSLSRRSSASRPTNGASPSSSAPAPPADPPPPEGRHTPPPHLRPPPAAGAPAPPPQAQRLGLALERVLAGPL